MSKTSTVEERVFYIHQAATLHWDKYTLRNNLKSDLFHHQSQMPNNFAATMPSARHAAKAIAMFKDDYLLDFINVEELGERDPQDIDERVIENSIVSNVKNFILTFGKDFTFIGNQVHIDKFGHDHYVDLLFFNRELQSLVVFELKKVSSSLLISDSWLHTFVCSMMLNANRMRILPSVLCFVAMPIRRMWSIFFKTIINQWVWQRIR